MTISPRFFIDYGLVEPLPGCMQEEIYVIREYRLVKGNKDIDQSDHYADRVVGVCMGYNISKCIRKIKRSLVYRQGEMYSYAWRWSELKDRQPIGGDFIVKNETIVEEVFYSFKEGNFIIEV